MIKRLSLSFSRVQTYKRTLFSRFLSSPCPVPSTFSFVSKRAFNIYKQWHNCLEDDELASFLRRLLLWNNRLIASGVITRETAACSGSFFSLMACCITGVHTNNTMSGKKRIWAVEIQLIKEFLVQGKYSENSFFFKWFLWKKNQVTHYLLAFLNYVFAIITRKNDP